MMATREGTEALQLLGLARRAGAVVAGVGRSREAVRAGRAALVLVAADASDGQRSKIERISRARTIPLAVLADRTELGAAVGEPPLSALVVLDAGFGHRILGRIQRREASGPASRTSIGGTNE